MLVAHCSTHHRGRLGASFSSAALRAATRASRRLAVPSARTCNSSWLSHKHAIAVLTRDGRTVSAACRAAMSAATRRLRLRLPGGGTRLGSARPLRSHSRLTSPCTRLLRVSLLRFHGWRSEGGSRSGTTERLSSSAHISRRLGEMPQPRDCRAPCCRHASGAVRLASRRNGRIAETSWCGWSR